MNKKEIDRLIEDECEEVRVEVARQGFGLDKLIGDEHPEARAAAAEKSLKRKRGYRGRISLDFLFVVIYNVIIKNKGGQDEISAR